MAYTHNDRLWLAGWFDRHVSIQISKTRRESAVRQESSSTAPDLLREIKSIAGGTIQRLVSVIRTLEMAQVTRALTLHGPS